MTITFNDRARAFARQAKADFESRDVLDLKDSPESQHLHFLQMACEKLCKAHYFHHGGTLPSGIESSHALIAKRLPQIIRDVLRDDIAVSGKSRSVILRGVAGFAREIELLAPAVDANGARPDNCEYPWVDATGVLQVPAEYDFLNLRFCQKEFGRVFLRLIRQAIAELTDI